jgi:DNA recombination protein RmuC
LTGWRDRCGQLSTAADRRVDKTEAIQLRLQLVGNTITGSVVAEGGGMIIGAIILNTVLMLVLLAFVWRMRAGLRQTAADATEPLRQSMYDRLAAISTEIASGLERTKGDLRQELTDRLDSAFRRMRESVDAQMLAGRSEQSQTLSQTVARLENKFGELQGATEKGLLASADRQSASLSQARAELTESLERNRTTVQQELGATTVQMREELETIRTKLAERLEASAMRQSESLLQVRQELASAQERSGASLKADLATLIGQTRDSLEAIRAEVDQKLLAISDRVQDKLDQNIKEGFRQFEKVQEHLRAAEEQLRSVTTLGNSINDLNNLLKLPHLRGRFGEESLERLLQDFLPASMYELQAPAGKEGHGRPDAIIKFPERVLPIDAKFPREQVLPLFENADPAQLAAARENFARVMKDQARRIASYIRPDDGTTDMALMYLPSETLYMEAVLNSSLAEALNKLRVFPVSPNTLIVTLQSIQMVFKMYEFAKGYERVTEELKKAQTAFGYFEGKFDEIGKSLGKAQQAYDVARGHLNRYRNKVIGVTGEIPDEISTNGHLPIPSAK